MKKIILLCCVFVLCIGLFANNFSDVPKDHWAYSSLEKLEGFIQEYPDGTYKGNNTLTRYEFAAIIAKILSLTKNEYDFVTKEDLKKSDLPINTLLKKEEVENLSKLVNEFSKELDEIGINVNETKLELERLNERVALIEKEQKRIKISGIATLFYKTHFKDEPVDKIGKNKRSFAHDFQLDVTGKVNNNINVNLSLVAGDYIAKQVSGYSKKWDTLVNRSEISLLPYYVYSDMNFDSLKVNLGRMPMQINKYVFRRYDIDTYAEVKRMDSGDYAVDGIDINKTFGEFGLRGWFVKPQTDMFYDPTMFEITNGLNAFGFENPIKAMGGGQLEYKNKSVKVTGLYSKFYSYKSFKGVKSSIDNAALYGGTFDAFLGNFSIDSAYYMQHTPDVYESGLLPINKSDKAQLLAVNLNYKNKNFSCGTGYKDVDKGYLAPGDWEAMGSFHNYDNIKGPTFNADYILGKWTFNGLFNNYHAKDKALAPDDERTRYIRFNVTVDTNPLGLLGLKYENINRLGNKVGVWTFTVKKRVGNAYFKLGYQNLDIKFQDQINNYFFGQATYTF